VTHKFCGRIVASALLTSEVPRTNIGQETG